MPESVALCVPTQSRAAPASSELAAEPMGQRMSQCCTDLTQVEVLARKQPAGRQSTNDAATHTAEQLSLVSLALTSPNLWGRAGFTTVGRCTCFVGLHPFMAELAQLRRENEVPIADLLLYFSAATGICHSTWCCVRDASLFRLRSL